MPFIDFFFCALTQNQRKFYFIIACTAGSLVLPLSVVLGLNFLTFTLRAKFPFSISFSPLFYTSLFPSHQPFKNLPQFLTILNFPCSVSFYLLLFYFPNFFIIYFIFLWWIVSLPSRISRNPCWPKKMQFAIGVGHTPQHIGSIPFRERWVDLLLYLNAKSEHPQSCNFSPQHPLRGQRTCNLLRPVSFFFCIFSVSSFNTTHTHLIFSFFLSPSSLDWGRSDLALR